MEKTIRLLVPDMPSREEIIPYLDRIDANRWYTNFGPLVQEFEAELAGHFEVDGTVPSITTVSDCTVGLELALNALDLPAGSLVAVPGLTFVATATAIIRAGYKPLVVDVDPDSWLLTPAIARQAIQQANVAAVMPVSTFGASQDVQAWDDFVEQTNIPVVIDAAGAFGNQPMGRRVSMVFSLHATKALGIGEGGFVLSHDRKYIERIRILTNFGIDPLSSLVYEAGTNGKLSEYHAAVGLAALARWPDVKARRHALQSDYLAAFQQTGLKVGLQSKDYLKGIFPTFPIALANVESASRIREMLLASRVETRKWYCPPIHRHPGLGRNSVVLNVSHCESLADRLIGIPFHTQLTRADIQYVVTVMQKALT